MVRKFTELDVVWEESAGIFVVQSKGGDDYFEEFVDEQDAWDWVKTFYINQGIEFEEYEEE